MNQDDEKKKEVISNMLAGWFGKWADAEPTKQTQSSNNGWINVDDELPTISDQYWVAYCAVHKTNQSEKLEFDYCTAHFNEFEKRWYVKDQMFYTQRRCKVVYWQPLPELPQKKTKRTLVLALLADNYPFVLVHKETYALRLCDKTIIDELNLDDYLIDCKMTGQTIIDYVDGKVIFETTKEQK